MITRRGLYQVLGGRCATRRGTSVFRRSKKLMNFLLDLLDGLGSRLPSLKQRAPDTDAPAIGMKVHAAAHGRVLEGTCASGPVGSPEKPPEPRAPRKRTRRRECRPHLAHAKVQPTSGDRQRRLVLMRVSSASPMEDGCLRRLRPGGRRVLAPAKVVSSQSGA
jgi:hypothetical protein